MKHHLINELSGAGVNCISEEAILFITKQIHNGTRNPPVLLGGEPFLEKKLVSDSDILEYYALNGKSSGLVFTKGENYDPLTLMWLLGKKGVPKDLSSAFINNLENFAGIV